MEVNWRKKLKPLTYAAPTYFSRKHHRQVTFGLCLAIFILFFWSRHVLDSCWFVLTRVGLELICVDSCWTRVGSCWLVSDSCWFVLTRVGLVLIRVDSCQIIVDSFQTRADSCWIVLIRVDSCWPVLILVY